MSSQSVLTQSDYIFQKKKKNEIWTQTCTQGKYHVKMKAEVGVMTLQAKKHQRLPVNHQKQKEKNGTDFSSEPSEESNPANSLILDFQLLEPWDNKFPLSNPPSLLYFVMAALTIHRGKY